MRAELNGKKLAILSYHKIGAPPCGSWNSWFYVPEETLVQQLTYLATHGWVVIDQRAFLNGLKNPASLPRQGALITFDDGYRSVRTVALPWLRRLGFPAIVFVPTDFIGRHNEFEEGSEPDELICDWDDLRKLASAGWSIQPHGASHRRFSQLPVETQRAELLKSKTALEEGLGRPAEIFAFPYGDDGSDPQALRTELEHAGYRAACLYRGGPISFPLFDPYRLPRLAMGPDTDMEAALVRGKYIPLPEQGVRADEGAVRLA